MSRMEAASRSGFVTALAWLFIVLGGFATLMGLLQNLMINLLLPIAVREEGAKDPPWAAAFMFDYIHLIFLGFLAVSALTLAAAIGLLLRRNWARLVFIGLMGFGILWNLASAEIRREFGVS